jgi:hypothetical protein
VYSSGGSTLTGTINIASGATLRIGYDSTSGINVNGTIATISGTVTGAGTLHAAGYVFNNWSGVAIASAVIAADLQVPTVTLGEYVKFNTKPDSTPTQISSGTVVTANGRTTLTSPVAVVNNGTINITVGSHTFNGQSLFGGLHASSCSGATGASLTNVGTINLTDTNGGAYVNVCTLTNSGTISRSNGTGQDTLSAAQLTNTGTVVAQTGSLLWTTTTGQIDDGSVGGGSGLVIMNTGTTTATADATIGDNVWVVRTATLTGTTVIPSGSTVRVGYTPAYSPNQTAAAGTISGVVSGQGTLSVAGHLFNNFPNGSVTSTAYVAADLDVANVTLGQYTTMNVKPDSTPTVVGTGSVVTLAKTPALASGLNLVTNGTLDFGINGYFACATCTVTIGEDGAFVLNNPDGNFTHGFTINSGTFNNQGVIKLTGYLPGTWVVFGSNVTLTGSGAGKAMLVNLQQPLWIQNLVNGNSAPQFANALTQTGMNNLARNAAMYAVAYLGDIGVGQCTTVNVSIVAAGSAGVCMVVDPTGSQAVQLTVAGGTNGGVNWPSSASWDIHNLLDLSPSYGIDLGALALWKSDPENGQGFDVHTDLGGPAWCMSGTLVGSGLVGATGQHCWSPGNNQEFQLKTFPLTQPGVHSGYLGAVVGTPTISEGVMLGYSVVIACGEWYTLTNQKCPPTNQELPEVTGTLGVGQVLTTDNGVWTVPDPNAPPVTFTYQWLRCTSSSLGSCTTISGATSSSYTTTATDQGKWLTARVTASNSGGLSQPATAVPVGPIP